MALAPILVDFLPLWQNIDFSDHGEEKFRTLIPYEISLWISFIFTVDSILLIVRELWMWQLDGFHYCITIHHKLQQFRHYLGNHSEYGIDHGEQNYSEWNFVIREAFWKKKIWIIWNPYFLPPWWKIHWNGGLITPLNIFIATHRTWDRLFWTQ